MTNEERPEGLPGSLKGSSDDQFFNHLENHVKHTISIFTRNVLMINGYNTANTLSLIDDNSFQEIEDFMRQDFIRSMLNDDAVFSGSYGKFSKIPNHLTLVDGERRHMLLLAKACATLCETKSHQNQNSEYSTQVTEDEIGGNVEISSEKADHLYDSLFSWITSHKDLAAVPQEDFHFKYNRSSYTERKNGSASIYIKCPNKQCLKGFVVTCAEYRSYYKRRKNVEQTQIKFTSPRWHLASVQKHILQTHSIRSRIPNSDETGRTSEGIGDNSDESAPRSDEIARSTDHTSRPTDENAPPTEPTAQSTASTTDESAQTDRDASLTEPRAPPTDTDDGISKTNRNSSSKEPGDDETRTKVTKNQTKTQNPKKRPANIDVQNIISVKRVRIVSKHKVD